MLEFSIGSSFGIEGYFSSCLFDDLRIIKLGYLGGEIGNFYHSSALL